MKLAEALILRADAWKRLLHVRDRLNKNASVQEGTEPTEQPADLMREHDEVLASFNDLVKRINRTNVRTAFDDARTLADALADRDRVSHARSTMQGVINAAGGSSNNFRATRSEIRVLPTVDVAALQKQLDALARQRRELDTRIQMLNWTVDLLD